MERCGAMVSIYLFTTVLMCGLSCNALPIQTSTRLELIQALINHDENIPGVLDQSPPGTFEGDMILTPIQKKAIREDVNARKTGNVGRKRKILADTNAYWPQAMVTLRNRSHGQIYPFSVPGKFIWHRIQSAIHMWESQTCIRFIPRSRALSEQLGHKDYVLIRPWPDSRQGCISNVGRIRGMQSVNISVICSAGRIAHELGHTIGFVHEQSRPDRDLYVHINYNNVAINQTGQFEKYSNSKVTTYRLPYDIGSIMHYKSTAFSKDQRMLQTITTDDPLVQKWMGQRNNISFLDAKLANLAYRCHTGCPVSPPCQNGGYIGPSCTCVCPVGLTGPFCDTPHVSKGCGGRLTATHGVIQSSNYPASYNPDTECSWLIEAPEDSSIDLQIQEFHIEEDFDDECNNDYLEIKLYGVQQVGQKYCGESANGRNITYHSGGSLLIRFVSDFATEESGFRIIYRIV
ncbi:blastula protease 10-like [Pecten maximus]|uniref:blastula protease 10-like n=1 Tax=Pecten maximus TaxID=6579 RepID=UPI001457EAB6|nr:blastula protease 10-like [Pecten maximus]